MNLPDLEHVGPLSWMDFYPDPLFFPFKRPTEVTLKVLVVDHFGAISPHPMAWEHRIVCAGGASHRRATLNVSLGGDILVPGELGVFEHTPRNPLDYLICRKPTCGGDHRR